MHPWPVLILCRKGLVIKVKDMKAGILQLHKWNNSHIIASILCGQRILTAKKLKRTFFGIGRLTINTFEICIFCVHFLRKLGIWLISGTSPPTFVSVDLSRLGFCFFVQQVLGLFCKFSPHMSGFTLGVQPLSFPLLLTVKVCRHGGRLKKGTE